MLKFRIEIECENDAFTPDPVKEIRTLLLDVIVALRKKELRKVPPYNRVFIQDTNGNQVGHAMFVDDPEYGDGE